jgi:hypothetical protein
MDGLGVVGVVGGEENIVLGLNEESEVDGVLLFGSVEIVVGGV